jgi:hypothetical protein
VIAVEDRLDATVILAVSDLGRQASKYGYDSWDGKMCAVAAALVMSESRKDRRSDEFLELMEAFEKYPDDEELKKLKEDYGRIEDYVLDCHTVAGRKMGRGERYWLETSSETVNKMNVYDAWREQFWKPLMMRLAKEKVKV